MFTQELQKQIVRVLSLFLIIVSVYFVFKAINEIKAMKTTGLEYNTISIEGHGEAVAIPDVARFSVTIQERADTVAAAQESVNTVADELITYLREQGVAAGDIKTASYNIGPRYEWRQVQCISFPCPGGNNVLVGYEASQTVEVTVRDTEMAGDLLSGVGSLDVDNVSGLTFEVDDPADLKMEAREEAIAEARENAERLAEALGVKLGDIVSYYEMDQGYMPYYDKVSAVEGRGGDMAVSTPANVPSGEQTIISNVNVTFRIK